MVFTYILNLTLTPSQTRHVVAKAIQIKPLALIVLYNGLSPSATGCAGFETIPHTVGEGRVDK